MNKSCMLGVSSLLLGLSISQGSLAQEPRKAQPTVITIETAKIRGNQELPTVLYLIPWQAPQINPLPAGQTAELNQRALEPIERNSFRRLLQYHEQFKSARE